MGASPPSPNRQPYRWTPLTSCRPQSLRCSETLVETSIGATSGAHGPLRRRHSHPSPGNSLPTDARRRMCSAGPKARDDPARRDGALAPIVGLIPSTAKRRSTPTAEREKRLSKSSIESPTYQAHPGDALRPTPRNPHSAPTEQRLPPREHLTQDTVRQLESPCSAKPCPPGSPRRHARAG